MGSGSFVGALIAGGASALAVPPALAATRLSTNISVLNVSDKLTVGSGERFGFLPTRVDVRSGTSANPDVGAGVPLKVCRTIAHTQAQRDALTGQPGTDGSDILNAIYGEVHATAASQTQPVGIRGTGSNRGTTRGSDAIPDSVGGYFTGGVEGAGIGTGIGACLYGRTNSSVSTSGAVGCEIVSWNARPTNAAHLDSSVRAAWMHAGGGRHAGVGLHIGNPMGAQFQTGIQFDGTGASNAFVGSTTGATIQEDIRSDSSASTSLLVRGTHATAAIAVAPGAGKVLIGTEAGKVSGSLLEVGGFSVTQDKRVGMFGAEPVAQPRGYSPPYDMATLGKLIEDLKGLGLIAA